MVIGRAVKIVLPALCLISGCDAGPAAEKDSLEVDSPSVYSRIRDEISRSSSIEENLQQLSDVYGPRLTGTPRYVEMVAWVESRIRSWGIELVEVEVYGDGDRGWEVASFSASMTAPVFAALGAQPVCCSQSTQGTVTGVPVVIDFYDLQALQAMQGQMQGRILLHPDVTAIGQPESGSWSDERLLAAANRIEAVTPDGLDGPGSEVTYVERLRQRENENNNNKHELVQFLIDEGVAALMRSSSAPAGVVNNRFDSSIVEFNNVGDPKPVPFFVLPREQHTRLLTLFREGHDPVIELDLDTRFHENPEYHVNLIAEIPGTDPILRDEVIMLGAHLDSVETATGAADNGIGSATSMEVLRVLKALDLAPRRTVRIALWGGEEQGLKGSSAYVRRHVGDIMTGEYSDEHQRISAYFNHDNNGHDIRGIFTVGHQEVKTIFEPLFRVFEDVGANTVTIENACCTDILVFDATGIPSFEWIHDPEMYFTHQLHTDLDVSAMVNLESARRNASIIATVIYETAMLDEMLPRKTD